MKTIDAQVIDSTHLRLLQPIQLPKRTRVTIVVAPLESGEREAWLQASASGLNLAYGDGEPEYPTELIKELNPEFAR